MRHLRHCLPCAVALAAAATGACRHPASRPPAGAGPPAPAGEWAAYGHDPLGSRFSPLTQINRENVGRLTLAWTYRTGEASVHTQQPAKFEATPLMVDATLYLSTPFGRAIALGSSVLSTARAGGTPRISAAQGGEAWMIAASARLAQ